MDGVLFHGFLQALASIAAMEVASSVSGTAMLYRVHSSIRKTRSPS